MLLPAVVLSAPCCVALDVALDVPLTRLLGGFWGVVTAPAAVGAKLGALRWTGETGQRPRRAWRAGAGLAPAAIALYARVVAGRRW